MYEKEVNAVRQKFISLKTNSFSINFLRGSKSTTGIEYEMNIETSLSLEQSGLYEDHRQAVWPEKNRQMSIKNAQKWFTTKMIDFDTFTKIA